MAYMSARELLSGLPVKMAIDATERNNMLQIATSEGVTFDDLLNSAVDANIMFNTTCPAGQVFDQATQQCVADGTDPRPCPDGTAYNATTNTCDPITTTDPRPCPDGTAYNATTNTCDPITTTGCTNADGSPKTCAEGFTLDASCNCIRDACPTGQELFNGVCVPICPTGFTRNAAGVCQENITVCEDGYTLNPITGNCVPNNSIPNCDTGEKYNPATGQCEKSLSIHKKSTSPQLFISRCPITLACMQPAKSRLTQHSGKALHGPRSSILMATSLTLITRLRLVCARPPDRDTTGHRPR
jgi:hypothetical protein